jgi:hypothetical protein
MRKAVLGTEMMAPEVGLEPTTLRLTVRDFAFSALLVVALYRSYNEVYRTIAKFPGCGYYPLLPTFLRQGTHKSPHSFETRFCLSSEPIVRPLAPPQIHRNCRTIAVIDRANSHASYFRFCCITLIAAWLH